MLWAPSRSRHWLAPIGQSCLGPATSRSSIPGGHFAGCMACSANRPRAKAGMIVRFMADVLLHVPSLFDVAGHRALGVCGSGETRARVPSRRADCGDAPPHHEGWVEGTKGLTAWDSRVHNPYCEQGVSHRREAANHSNLLRPLPARPQSACCPAAQVGTGPTALVPSCDTSVHRQPGYAGQMQSSIPEPLSRSRATRKNTGEGSASTSTLRFDAGCL